MASNPRLSPRLAERAACASRRRQLVYVNKSHELFAPSLWTVQKNHDTSSTTLAPHRTSPVALAALYLSLAVGVLGAALVLTTFER